MLPLGLLTAAQGHPMLVELKNGETLNGHLVNCDNWMNLTLKEVVQTSPEGDRFFRLPEVYVRGNNIKYLRVPEEIVDQQVGDGHRRDLGPNAGRNSQVTGSSASSQQKTADTRSESTSKPKRKQTKLNGNKRRKVRKEIPNDLEERSTNNLENLLQDHVEDCPTVAGTIRILQVLIRDRQIKPQVRHYRALILANTDPQRGSPIQVRKLLQEMEQNGVPADSGTLHGALKVLAIHPDYLLRQDILHTLRDRWITLSPSGCHNMITGLIRERQYELALETLSGTEARGVQIQPWLHALLIYNLCDAEEFGEALPLMRSRVDHGHGLSPNLWYHVLDKASEALHYDTTLYVWKERVEPRFINPSHGTCSNVLLVAARVGDTELGNSVFKLLAERGTPFTLNDYETLIDIYVAAGDLETAFIILCMIQSTRLEPDETSTRSMAAYMMRMQSDTEAAWKNLKRLRNEKGRDIPLAAANLVIEQSVQQRRIDQAMDFYKELQTICPMGANVTTFNHLINGCRKAEKKDLAMFLVQEMVGRGVMPDITTYEHLVLFCIETVSFESAYMYFTDLTERGWSFGERVRRDIFTKCYESDDKYAKLLQHHQGIRKPFKIDRKIDVKAADDAEALKRKGSTNVS
ncbi:hypothetical protein FQN54_005207 [Arachnomyces sp. PD_36]|nr:hypothetical protein FQN54_005207 [Arachnomyces sp. PD_36]